MAEFRTAYLQRMIPLDVVVVGTVKEKTDVTSENRKAAICRNDFVVYVPKAGEVPAYITKATQTQIDAKEATHIIALTDMTIGKGHVPTDLKDYRSSELVGATSDAAPTGPVAVDVIKKVGLYPIYEWGDIVQDADQMDAASNAQGGN